MATNYRDWASQYGQMTPEDFAALSLPEQQKLITSGGVDPNMYGNIDTAELAAAPFDPESNAFLQEEAAKKSLRGDLGISAAAAGLQLAAELYPTRTQREQKKELAELERQVEAGEAALDPKVSALMDQAAAASNKMAAEMGQRLEGQAAATGSTSAGAQRRIQQNVMETAAEAKRKTGLEKAAAEQRAEEQRASTIASMRAQRFEEEKSRRAAASRSIGKAAILTAKLRAEKPLEVADIEGLKDQGFSNDQILEIWKESQRSMRSQDLYMEAMLDAGTLTD